MFFIIFCKRILKARCCLNCKEYENMGGGGVLHGTEVAYMLLTQQPWVQFLVFPRIFLCSLDLLTALLITVDRTLITAIKPILYLLVAS